MFYLNEKGTTEVSVKFTTKTQDDQIEVKVLSYDANGNFVPWQLRAVDERIIIDEATNDTLKFSLGENRERGFAAIVLKNNYDEMVYIHAYVVQRLVHSKKFTFKVSDFTNNDDGTFSFKIVSKNATKDCGWEVAKSVLDYDITQEGDIVTVRLLSQVSEPFESIILLKQERSGSLIGITTLNQCDKDGTPMTQFKDS